MKPRSVAKRVEVNLLSMHRSSPTQTTHKTTIDARAATTIVGTQHKRTKHNHRCSGRMQARNLTPLNASSSGVCIRATSDDSSSPHTHINIYMSITYVSLKQHKHNIQTRVIIHACIYTCRQINTHKLKLTHINRITSGSGGSQSDGCTFSRHTVARADRPCSYLVVQRHSKTTRLCRLRQLT